MSNYLNINIPFFWGFLDTGFLYDKNPSPFNDRIPMEFFLYTSIPNRCGLFTGMSEWGTQHARIPIHYIHTEPDGGKDYPLDFLQLWDSFSYNCAATVIEYVKNRSCKVMLKDKTTVDGTYMFTLDWCNGGYSEIAAGHKTGHVINADGRVFIQPNNRIVRWNDGGAFTSKTLKGRPDWKVFSQEFSCEASGGRWVADSNEELYWYGFKDGNAPSTKAEPLAGFCSDSVSAPTINRNQVWSLKHAGLDAAANESSSKMQIVDEATGRTVDTKIPNQ